MSERFWRWVAWMLPSGLVYWAAIRLIANATQGEYGNQIIGDLTALDAIGKWGE